MLWGLGVSDPLRAPSAEPLSDGLSERRAHAVGDDGDLGCPVEGTSSTLSPALAHG